jgi:hypothetical protein
MAAEWAPGTKVVLLDVTVYFDGTTSNTATTMRAGYSVALPSGKIVPETKIVTLPISPEQLAVLAPSFAALYGLVAGAEGVS